MRAELMNRRDFLRAGGLVALGLAGCASIAQAHGVSIPQVILRWNRQRGIVVIPGSSNPDHIAEDLDIHGFSLTEQEMARIAALERVEKHDWY